MVVLVLVLGWQQLGVKEISGAVGGPIVYVMTDAPRFFFIWSWEGGLTGQVGI